MPVYTPDDIKTAHPGGLQDIIDALHHDDRYLFESKKRNRLDKEQNRYVEETIYYSSNMADVRAEFIKLFRHTWQSTGQLMGAFTNLLEAFELPTPGETHWDKPAADWPSVKRITKRVRNAQDDERVLMGPHPDRKRTHPLVMWKPQDEVTEPELLDA